MPSLRAAASISILSRHATGIVGIDHDRHSRELRENLTQKPSFLPPRSLP